MREDAGTEEVYVALVGGGKFKELARKILVHGSLLHDGKLLGHLQYYAFIEWHFRLPGKSAACSVRALGSSSIGTKLVRSAGAVARAIAHNP
jgi:hypothetical protein